MSEDKSLEERLRAWAAAPDEAVDWKDVLRRAGVLHRHPARRQLVPALVAAVAVVSAAGGVFYGTHEAGRGLGSAGHLGPTGPAGPRGAIDTYGPTGGLGPTGPKGPTGRIPQVVPTGHARILPTLFSPVELAGAAMNLGMPIYWAGPLDGYHYEFQRTGEGYVYIRYLPAGVLAGDSGRKYLMVGTYPVPGALAVLKEQANGKAIAGPGGSIILASGRSVYLAFPNVDYEIEIYDANHAVALGTAQSGVVRPLGPPSAPDGPKGGTGG